jgi:Uma2 family endonuclease
MGVVRESRRSPMSTVTTGRTPQRHSEEGAPYDYGWRFVRTEKPDGTVEVDQVPLTLEDVLFPEDGDFIVQSRLHGDDRTYLTRIFRYRLSGDPHAEVLSNTGVDWNLPGVRPLCPDIAVFLGLKRRINWAILDVAAEGARPALVVEITSRSTRSNDLGAKFEYYYQAGVPLYVIADATEDERSRRLKLIAYRHTPDGYARIEPDARGRIWLDPVGVWLGVTVDPTTGGERLACYVPQGWELGDYGAVVRESEEARACAAAEARAREEADARAAAAEARIRDLEAAIKRLD